MWRVLSYVPLFMLLLTGPSESFPHSDTLVRPCRGALFQQARLVSHDGSLSKNHGNCDSHKRNEGSVSMQHVVPIAEARPNVADASRRSALFFLWMTAALTDTHAVAAEGKPQTETSTTTPLVEWPPSSAAVIDCDDRCREDRQRRLAERRALMQQSRSSTSRQDVLDLSRQRATLYGTTFQGAQCPDGIPCL